MLFLVKLKLVHGCMYADDTALYTVCKDVNDLNCTLNTNLEKVSNWLMRNKLSLNVRKTELLVLDLSRGYVGLTMRTLMFILMGPSLLVSENVNILVL